MVLLSWKVRQNKKSVSINLTITIFSARMIFLPKNVYKKEIIIKFQVEGSTVTITDVPISVMTIPSVLLSLSLVQYFALPPNWLFEYEIKSRIERFVQFLSREIHRIAQCHNFCDPIFGTSIKIITCESINKHHILNEKIYHVMYLFFLSKKDKTSSVCVQWKGLLVRIPLLI